MKKLISLSLMLAIFATTSVMAQTSKTDAAEKIAKQYTETVKLTEDQASQAKTIFKDHLTASQSNWTAADGDKEAFKTSQTATFKATDAKFKALLTDEQLKVYEAKKQDLKKKALDHYLAEMMEKE